MAKSATTALYSEFRRESGGVLHVYQYLVVPSTINLIDDSVTPLVSMYRQLTAAHPRRPWTTHNAEVVTAVRKRVVALENGRIVRDETGAAYHRED